MALELTSTARTRNLTASYQGERDEDGRPSVAPDILDRMRNVTIEEAWGVLQGHGYRSQFDGGWLNLHPERVVVGRAVTCAFVPHRPDLNEAVEKEGAGRGRVGGQNSWVIDTLVEGDVLVVDLFGKIEEGTFIGDNLGTAIATNTGGTGLIVDGSIRDDFRVRELPFNVLCRGTDPSGIANVTLTQINGPVRIGRATCLPGDVVLATASGVIFVPPQFAIEVVESSESTRLRDYWGKMSIREGRHTPGEVDRAWTEAMNAAFEQWRSEQNLDELLSSV